MTIKSTRKCLKRWTNFRIYTKSKSKPKTDEVNEQIDQKNLNDKKEQEIPQNMPEESETNPEDKKPKEKQDKNEISPIEFSKFHIFNFLK